MFLRTKNNQNKSMNVIMKIPYSLEGAQVRACSAPNIIFYIFHDTKGLFSDYLT